jgi:uncharacterized phage infection (PIP) family protein YhgE
VNEMDIFYNRFLFIVGLCAAVLCFWTGCASSPVTAGGGEEIGKLRSAYNELEQRYNELAGDYRDLVQRQSAITAEQQRLIEEQSATADRIGDGVEQLAETAGSIEQSVAGIQANNREAVKLIQQYIESLGREGRENIGAEGTGAYISDMGGDSDTGGNPSMGD